MTSGKFAELSARDFENGAVLDETLAALRDGERMRAIVAAMAEDYETTGHQCCPLCSGCADETPEHTSDCVFGQFLAERKKKEDAR